jgi:hypothetical protein
MAYLYVTPQIGGQPIGNTSSTAQHRLGQEIKVQDSALFEGEFIYCVCSNSVAQYDCVVIKGGYTIAPITITNAKTAVEIGFVQIANGTKDTYMWVQKNGRPIVKLALATQADAPLFASSTSGTLTSASTSVMIQGIVAITQATNSANPKTCVARYPTVQQAKFA